MRFLSDNYLNFLTQDTFYVDSKMGFELLRSWFGQRTYHKDSYMANRLGGWEGRYRRTESPSTAARRNSGKEIMCQSSTTTSPVNGPPNSGCESRISLNNTFSRLNITSDQQKKLRRHKEMSRHNHILTGKKIPPDVLPKPYKKLHISSSSLMELPGATKQENIDCTILRSRVLQSSKSTISLNHSIPSSSEDQILKQLVPSTIPSPVTQDKKKNMQRHSSLWSEKPLESVEKIAEPATSTSKALHGHHHSCNEKWVDHNFMDCEECTCFRNNQKNHQKKKLPNYSDSYVSLVQNNIDSGLSGNSSMSNMSSSSRADSCKTSLRSASILSTDNSINSTLSSKGSTLSSQIYSTLSSQISSTPSSKISCTLSNQESFSTTESGPLESFSQITRKYSNEEYADSGNGTLQNTKRKFQEEIECEAHLNQILADNPNSNRYMSHLATSPDTKNREDYIENITDELNEEKENRKLNPILLSTKLTELENQNDDSEHETFLDPLRMKEENTKSIKHKLEVLHEEEKSLRTTISSNEEVGQLVAKRLQDSNCLPKQMDKFMNHLKESENIIKLLLNISGRLAKYENDLSSQNVNGETADPNQCKKMEYKIKMRQKLCIQLEDSKRLKESLDQRTEALSVVIRRYVNQGTNELFLNYLKVKSQLNTELKETHEKIILAENQMMAISDVHEIKKTDWKENQFEKLEQDEAGTKI